ncbi:hypothetical protein FOZ63_004520 [Perkinsus olseni]|uniref:Uncharacterized protein n=1 Tax=Perkinsus olseni TaxID=32597 RepID=A0A7J6RNH6_PEROL|nr:hypothetical protein FOZ60_001278 [Perkinsus olseni]KAF4722097.1 hypothetical protein FOZ63_004520 [Perkinsus olseni]
MIEVHYELKGHDDDQNEARGELTHLEAKPHGKAAMRDFVTGKSQAMPRDGTMETRQSVESLPSFVNIAMGFIDTDELNRLDLLSSAVAG